MSRDVFHARVSRRGCLSIEATVRDVCADGSVELEFAQAARCAECAGTCTWTRPRPPERSRIRNSLALEPGDVVRVSLPAQHLLMSAVLLHGLPLVSLLGGGLAGAAATQSDVGTLFGAIAGLAMSLAASQPLRRRAEALTIERTEIEPVQSSLRAARAPEFPAPEFPAPEFPAPEFPAPEAPVMKTEPRR